MPDSTLAGTISAVAGVFTALALVITAIGGVMAARRAHTKIDAVHKLVNQQHTDMVNYQRALIRALQVKGIEVPLDQSVAEPPAPTSPRHRSAR